jgi:hypothetical protein
MYGESYIMFALSAASVKFIFREILSGYMTLIL